MKSKNKYKQINIKFKFKNDKLDIQKKDILNKPYKYNKNVKTMLI
jgi:hypothetical protein